MTWREAAERYAQGQAPREACGLVVIRKGREVFVPCQNRAHGDDHFVISPEDYAAAEDDGEVVAVWHSHCGVGPDPSEADRVSCEASGVEWHIYAWPANRWASLRPCGYQAPLVGREFSHGTLDCYTLVRDWYARERHIILPDYPRSDDWWNHGQNLYLENFRAAGFVDGAELHPGAVLLMQICSPVPNHAAVYLGDDMILHHMHGRLSSRDVYGGMYRKHTVRVLQYAA